MISRLPARSKRPVASVGDATRPTRAPVRTAVRAVALVSLLLAATATAQTVRTINTGTWLGCKTKETKDELTQYIVDGDRVAYRRAATTYILEGKCVLFDEGERVYLVDTALFSGLVKLRRPGETVSYWTNT